MSDEEDERLQEWLGRIEQERTEDRAAIRDLVAVVKSAWPRVLEKHAAAIRRATEGT